MFSIRKVNKHLNKPYTVVGISIAAIAVLFPSALRLKRYYMVNDVTASNGNVRAFLMALRWCEGTYDASGYRALFGHSLKRPALFSDYKKHPNIRKQFKETDGDINYTTAAGAYQFIYPTWERLRKKLSLPDFSPSSQDRAAIELIAEVGAYDNIVKGQIQTALGKIRKIWASLPSAGYDQPTRKLSDVLQKYKTYGGILR